MIYLDVAGKMANLTPTLLIRLLRHTGEVTILDFPAVPSITQAITVFPVLETRSITLTLLFVISRASKGYLVILNLIEQAEKYSSL